MALPRSFPALQAKIAQSNTRRRMCRPSWRTLALSPSTLPSRLGSWAGSSTRWGVAPAPSGYRRYGKRTAHSHLALLGGTGHIQGAMFARALGRSCCSLCAAGPLWGSGSAWKTATPACLNCSACRGERRAVRGDGRVSPAAEPSGSSSTDSGAASAPHCGCVFMLWWRQR